MRDWPPGCVLFLAPGSSPVKSIFKELPEQRSTVLSLLTPLSRHRHQARRVVASRTSGRASSARSRGPEPASRGAPGPRK